MRPQNLTAEEQYNKMVNTPVSKLITGLAIPTVISMLVTSVYNMADTFFVSQLGTDASAAVGIVFPIMSIIQACGFTLGMGSGSLVSIRLGQKRNEEASIISSTAFFAALAETVFSFSKLTPVICTSTRTTCIPVMPSMVLRTFS